MLRSSFLAALSPSASVVSVSPAVFRYLWSRFQSLQVPSINNLNFIFLSAADVCLLQCMSWIYNMPSFICSGQQRMDLPLSPVVVFDHMITPAVCAVFSLTQQRFTSSQKIKSILCNLFVFGGLTKFFRLFSVLLEPFYRIKTQSRLSGVKARHTSHSVMAPCWRLRRCDSL